MSELSRFQRISLDIEQKINHVRGRAMGWTNVLNDRDREFLIKIAEAANVAGLENLEPSELPLHFSDRTDVGFKIVDKGGNGLVGYWRLVHNIRDQVGYKYSDEDLNTAITQAIEAAKAGTLKSSIDRVDYMDDLDF